jgi:cyanate permease
MLNVLMEMRGVGPRLMGTAAGIYFSVGELGGTLGPVIVGLLADLTGSFSPGLVGMAVILWIMIVPALRIRA